VDEQEKERKLMRFTEGERAAWLMGYEYARDLSREDFRDWRQPWFSARDALFFAIGFMTAIVCGILSWAHHL
jgi:hypothetical protein